MSLGVDLVPKKVCSLDCVYCEVGKTTKLTIEKDEYVPFDKITKALTDYFKNNPDPDYITFSGSGEPTLNSRLGDVLEFIKKERPHVPVAVLTNGTLLSDENVRKAISRADVVLPSLDAATQLIFEKINRPPEGLKIDTCIQGIIDFKNGYKGKIWLEVFILPGFNDSEYELTALREAIEEISPDSIQLNTLDRPGTVPDLKGATKEQLQQIIDFWKFDNIEIISSAPERKNIQSYRTDIESAIIETLARRPCTLDDLTKILGIHVSEINKYLDVLDSENRIKSIRLERGVFYQVKDMDERCE